VLRRNELVGFCAYGISAKPCRERDLVLAMIVERLLDPCSKLATTRQWHSTTLAEELGVSQATEDELYQAMAVRATAAHREKTRCAPSPPGQSGAL
jgi:hypothetical protein